MKKAIIVILAIIAAMPVKAQKFEFTEATDLTIVGKVFPDTPNPYKRMDYTKYGGWTEKDINLLDQSSGIIVSFKTDANAIQMRAIVERTGATGIGNSGFDLYIKKDGKWCWAGAAALGKPKDEYSYCNLVKNMAPGTKECIVYFPLRTVLTSAQVGVPEGCSLEPGEEPFKYDIALYGSSFTHGAGCTRSGNTLPGFLTRMTGCQFNSLGVSGDCMMQPQFLNALKDVQADAFFFDTFSNPSPQQIRGRTMDFIDTMVQTHPGVPMIFIRTIYRENRNFDTARDSLEAAKMATADSVMAIAVKRYKDVYYIKSSNAASWDNETTADGTHPSDFGYHIWAESLYKPLVKILRKYGIKP